MGRSGIVYGMGYGVHDVYVLVMDISGDKWWTWDSEVVCLWCLSTGLT